MEKRLALALFLSFLVLLFWPKPPREPGGDPGVLPGGIPAQLDPVTGAPRSVGEVPADVTAAANEAEPWQRTVLLGTPGERGRYQATFDNRGGTLVDLRLDGYYLRPRLTAEEKADPANWVPLLEEVRSFDGEYGSLAFTTLPSSAVLAQRLDRVRWEAEEIREGDAVVGVRFRHDPGTGVVFTKTILTVPGTYELACTFQVENVSFEGAGDLQPGRTVRFGITPALGVPRSASDGFYPEPKAVLCWGSTDEPKIQREERVYDKAKVESFNATTGIRWGGVESKYFAVLLRPLGSTVNAVAGARWRTVYDAAWVEENPEEATKPFRHVATDLDVTFSMPPPGESIELDFALFVGPKKRAVLAEYEPTLEALPLRDLGFFRTIGRAMLAILGTFHGLVGSWGVSIILLTLFVRAVLFPFNRRSQTAMARHATKMKRVQPKLNAIKEKYKDEPKKLREEQARVMQEEGAFPPLGGCLPMFVQIPVFFGLFSALRASFELRQAPFLYITDLSEPDRFLALDLTLPLIGDVPYLNILPPVMVVLWIVQQRVMPKPTDEQAQRVQKMMMWMPILFGVFLYNYPAGLSVYMITTSMFGILEQTVIKKIWPIDDQEQPKKKSGFMSRMAELSEQAKKMEQMKRQANAQRATQQKKRKKR